MLKKSHTISVLALSAVLLSSSDAFTVAPLSQQRTHKLSSTVPLKASSSDDNNIVLTPQKLMGGVTTFMAGIGFAAQVAFADPSMITGEISLSCFLQSILCSRYFLRFNTIHINRRIFTNDTRFQSLFFTFQYLDFAPVTESSTQSSTTLISAGAPSFGGGASFETLDFSLPSYTERNGGDSSDSAPAKQAPPAFSNPFKSDDPAPAAKEEETKKDTSAEDKAAAEQAKKEAAEKKAAEKEAAEQAKKEAAEKKAAEKAAAEQAKKEAAEKKAAAEKEKEAEAERKEAEKKERIERNKKAAEEMAARRAAEKEAEEAKASEPAPAPAPSPKPAPAPAPAPAPKPAPAPAPKKEETKKEIDISVPEIKIPSFKAPSFDVPKIDIPAPPKIEVPPAPTISAPPAPKFDVPAPKFDVPSSSYSLDTTPSAPAVPLEPQSVRDEKAAEAKAVYKEAKNKYKVRFSITLSYFLITNIVYMKSRS